MTESAASTSIAAVASARACLDVLRGAAVLLEHNKLAVVELLTGGCEGGYAASGEQEVLQALGVHISEVMKLCRPASECASGDPAAPSQSSVSVGGGVKRADVTRSPSKRFEIRGMQGGQQSPLNDDRAASATVRQANSSTTATSTVLTNVDLLVNILGYIGVGSGGWWRGRFKLNEMALVCRRWRDAAHSEALWRSLATELMPRLVDTSLPATQYELRTGAGGSYRQYLVRCGQVTRERRILNDREWMLDVVIQFDLWDTDGFCMFSSEDVMFLDVVDGNNNGDEGIDASVDGEGPPFSVASRHSVDRSNPPQTMADLFPGRDMYARVIVHDERTRHSVDMWSARNLVVQGVVEDSWGNRENLVVTTGETSISSVLYGHDSLSMRLGFVVERLDGANGEDDDQTLWSITRAFMRFSTQDQMSVGRLIWSGLH